MLLNKKILLFIIGSLILVTGSVCIAIYTVRSSAKKERVNTSKNISTQYSQTNQETLTTEGKKIEPATESITSSTNPSADTSEQNTSTPATNFNWTVTEYNNEYNTFTFTNFDNNITQGYNYFRGFEFIFPKNFYIGARSQNELGNYDNITLSLMDKIYYKDIIDDPLNERTTERVAQLSINAVTEKEDPNCMNHIGYGSYDKNTTNTKIMMAGLSFNKALGNVNTMSEDPGNGEIYNTLYKGLCYTFSTFFHTYISGTPETYANYHAQDTMNDIFKSLKFFYWEYTPDFAYKKMYAYEKIYIK